MSLLELAYTGLTDEDAGTLLSFSHCLPTPIHRWLCSASNASLDQLPMPKFKPAEWSKEDVHGALKILGSGCLAAREFDTPGIRDLFHELIDILLASV